jgi:hypothetical protein
MLLAGMSAAAAVGTQSGVCGPPPEILAQIERARAAPIVDRSAFDQNVSPFRALRVRYPDDLFVHESYQDAVQRFGVEGHLGVLTDEYQTLASEHSGDLMYRYLYARSLLGRGTYAAIQEMTEILHASPGFAPAHRMLAEIHSTEVFRDAEKENAESKNFLQICPGSRLARFSAVVPDKSPLIDRAEQLLTDNGDPDRGADLAQQGLKDDEWRLQRIRPFDWYSVRFKIQTQRELQAEYWRVWSIQVRCYRNAGKSERAVQLLARMEQRALQLRAQPGNTYCTALALLVRLYAEGNQRERAELNLEAMRRVVAAQADPDCAKQIGDLGKFMQTQMSVGSQRTATPSPRP